MTHKQKRVSWEGSVLRVRDVPRALKWKLEMGLDDKQLNLPHSLKVQETAECRFQPPQPPACGAFQEDLSRLALRDGNACALLEKVVSGLLQTSGVRRVIRRLLR